MDDISVSPSAVLSADLSGLEAHWGNGPFSKLSWDALNEQGVDHYVIERSLDGTNDFQPIAELAANGGPGKLETYSLFDHEAQLNRSNFYRVKVIDQDGSSAYSNTEELSAYHPADYLVQLYPNPVSAGSASQLMLYLAEDAEVHLSIYDLSGKLIIAQQSQETEGTHKLPLQIEGLPAGYYLVKYTTGSLSGTEKLIIE